MRKGNGRGGRLAGAIVLAMATALIGAWADSRAVAAEPIVRMPLGGSLAGQRGDRTFAVYVPTRFGGNLTIKATEGRVDSLVGPDGRVRTVGEDVGADAHGWYTFRVVGAKEPYTVTTEFVQVAQATRMPWNFYYWPTKSDSVHEPWDGTGDGIASTRAVWDDEQVVWPGTPVPPGADVVRAGPDGILQTAPAPGDTSTWFPNLYDDLTFRGADGALYATPAPMLKYDQLFNTSARSWEAMNMQSRDIQRWMGHCLGGAIASIMLNEPVPAPGSGLTVDELKGLWSEMGENHYNHQIGDNANNIPPGPPRPGLDPTDMHVARVHAMLETHVRGRRTALLANLRAFPPNGQPNEVWNHGIGKYTMKMSAVPGRGERSVRVQLETVSNTGSNLNEGDRKPRVNTYEYIVVYGLDGRADETQPQLCDWISVGGQAMYAPLNVMEVVSSRWQAHNPFMTEANVKAVDMANGGGGLRFAGTPPQFRPVAAYEGARAPAFAFGDNNGGVNFFGAGEPPPAAGRRFFRFMGR